MGRTVLPYSQVWEEKHRRWLKFRRALRQEDQAHLDRLFELARLHLQAGVHASNPWIDPLSMLLEHQKALIALTERLRRLEQLLRGGGLGDGQSPALPSNSPPNLNLLDRAVEEVMLPLDNLEKFA